MFGGSDVYQVPTDAPLPQAKIMRESGQFERPTGRRKADLSNATLQYLKGASPANRQAIAV